MSLREQLRVLVVDDMSISRGLMTLALEALGISNVTAASDGREALKSYKRAPVHLVLSDYHMPDVDGLTLLHTLRQEHKSKDVGFILITGSADDSIIEKGRHLGMNNFLRKPFSTLELKDCIETVVGRL